jgi:hypothetical protein
MSTSRKPSGQIAPGSIPPECPARIAMGGGSGVGIGVAVGGGNVGNGTAVATNTIAVITGGGFCAITPAVQTIPISASPAPINEKRDRCSSAHRRTSGEFLDSFKRFLKKRD